MSELLKSNLVAAVTSPLISMGRLLKDGWPLQTNGDGNMFLVRNPKQIPVHFKRTSLCAVGVIRMLSADHPSSSTRAGTGDDAKHVRALTLGRTLSGLGAGWVRIGDSIYALKINANQHVDSTCVPLMVYCGCVQLSYTLMMTLGSSMNSVRTSGGSTRRGEKGDPIAPLGCAVA